MSAADMETPLPAAPSSKSSRGPPKRKRTSDGDATPKDDSSVARPRGFDGYESSFQLASPGRADAAYTHTHAQTSTLTSPAGSASAASRATPPAAVAVLPGPGHVPVHVPVAGLQTQAQAYQDYQLHATGGSPSGHSRGQDRCAGPVFGHDNGVMPIAGAEAPTAYSRRSTAVPPASTYNQQYQQPPWFALGPPGDAIAQSHFQPDSSSSPPQVVPLHSIHMSGAVFPPPFNSVSPHQLSLPGQENVIADTNLGAPYPSVQTFQPHGFGVNQHLVSGEAGIPLHPHHQHHLSHPPPHPYHHPYPHPHPHPHPQSYIHPHSPPHPLPAPPPSYPYHPQIHSGPEQLAEGHSPFQVPTPFVYPAYNGQQLRHHAFADNRPPFEYPQASPGQTPMGGGPEFPETRQQAVANGYLAQEPAGPFPSAPVTPGSAVSPDHNGPITESSGSDAQDQGSSSFGQPVDLTGIDEYDIDAEPQDDDNFERDYDMENDLETTDAVDADADADADTDAEADANADPGVHDASPSGAVQQESSSAMAEEDTASPAASNKPRRSPLSPNHRKQAAETRKIKACTRCRMQKMRCDPDLTDPMGPCLGCQTFSKTSKKTIHRMPCYRGKITDAVLYRSGGLELTRRWKGTEMKDVTDRINPKDIRTIKFTLGICEEPITVEVVAFQPQSGDVTARFWTVPDGETGVRKKKDLAHYCLFSIHKTAAYFEDYIKKNAVDVMKRERAGGKAGARDVLERTYEYIIKRYQDLSGKCAVTGAEERELKFLGNIIVLWFAMRHSTGSSWLLGKELLGMKPETRDDTYPLFGRVSVPRMILAQFDSINHTRLLSKYGKLVLSELESLMSRNQPQHFFLIYACIFVLLREASWISEDRYRHARNNLGQNHRYSIPAFVESLHESCNNLLQHWHYFNCKTWPPPTEKDDRWKGPLGGISSEEYDLLMQACTDRAVQGQLDVWRRYKADNGHVTKPAANDVGGRPYEGRQVFYDWDHPFYWVAQLFEEDWHPHATYQREYIE
ncbi:hypothetical protein V8C44DRAFT_329963 [Trichoderma aethiopicum]